MDYCTLRYTAKNAAPHMAGAITVKMIRLPVGEDVRVPADVAGVIVRGVAPGAVEVVSGTPTPAPASGPVVTVAVARQALRSAALGVPASAPVVAAPKGKAKGKA